MNFKSLNILLNKTIKSFFIFTIVLTIYSGTAFAEPFILSMEGGQTRVPKGNTITKKIYGIPKITGELNLRFKWHAVSVIPFWYNPLKVVLKHGNTVIKSQNACYSRHSNKTPKCDIKMIISQPEAEKSGDWTLEVTNNSNEEVERFNIEKETGDYTPTMSIFKSEYVANCPSTKNLDMEGVSATVVKNGSVTRRITGITNAPGTLNLKIKWHADHWVPKTFIPLKIEVFDTKGNKVQALSGSFYSFHSDRTPKYDKTYQITDANLGGNQSWKIVVTNNSSFEAKELNIERGNDTLLMGVPAFKSTYKQKCP